MYGDACKEDRHNAKEKLVNGEIKFIFVVDIWEVNTILFLWPTKSLTVFLQQLERGLILSESKECLTSKLKVKPQYKVQ